MRLSKDFWLYEFTRSQTASRHGIDNTPPLAAIVEIRALVDNVLQPLRDFISRPININSGYRSEALNAAVRGSANSQHMKGQAADIECFGYSNVALFQSIRQNLYFDQLLLEFHRPEDGPNSGWVHVSFKSDGNNRGDARQLGA